MTLKTDTEYIDIFHRPTVATLIPLYTDGQTDGITISISCVSSSILTRDKKPKFSALLQKFPNTVIEQIKILIMNISPENQKKHKHLRDFIKLTLLTDKSLQLTNPSIIYNCLFMLQFVWNIRKNQQQNLYSILTNCVVF